MAAAGLGGLGGPAGGGGGLCTCIIVHNVLLDFYPMQFVVVFIMDNFVHQNALAHVSTAEDALQDDEIFVSSENEEECGVPPAAKRQKVSSPRIPPVCNPPVSSSKCIVHDCALHNPRPVHNAPPPPHPLGAAPE